MFIAVPLTSTPIATTPPSAPSTLPDHQLASVLLSMANADPTWADPAFSATPAVGVAPPSTTMGPPSGVFAPPPSTVAPPPPSGGSAPPSSSALQTPMMSQLLEREDGQDAPPMLQPHGFHHPSPWMQHHHPMGGPRWVLSRIEMLLLFLCSWRRQGYSTFESFLHFVWFLKLGYGSV